MAKLKLYTVDDDYVNFLLGFDKRVMFNKEDTRKHLRKYVGIILNINNIKYFAPLSSPKESDYYFDKGEKSIKKSMISIIRIVYKNTEERDELKGTIRLSNMIPVPDSVLTRYDVNNETDLSYKILIIKEQLFINANKTEIINNANIVYESKIKNYTYNYLKNVLDFKLLEEKSVLYIK